MKADEFLNQYDLAYEVIEHEEKAPTCEKAAELRDVKPSQVVKNLIVENNDGKVVHVLLPGDRELSAAKFGEYSMVDPEESKDITGQEAGTVHPFSTGLQHFVDERLFEQEKLSFTVGKFTRAAKVTCEVFKKALDNADFDYKVVDCTPTTEGEKQEVIDAGLNETEVVFITENGYRTMFLELSRNLDALDVFSAFKSLDKFDVEPQKKQVEELVERAENETHMEKLAEELAENGEVPKESPAFELEKVVEEVIARNQEAAEDLREGKESAINFLLGQVMQKTNGRADGEEVRDMIKRKI